MLFLVVFLVGFLVVFLAVFWVVLVQKHCFTRTKKRKKVSKKDSKESKEVSGLKYNIKFLMLTIGKKTTHWQSKRNQLLETSKRAKKDNPNVYKQEFVFKR